MGLCNPFNPHNVTLVLWVSECKTVLFNFNMLSKGLFTLLSPNSLVKTT